MKKELLKFKKKYRNIGPSETDELSEIILNIFSIKYSVTDFDYLRKSASCISLSTYFSQNYCISECPLSDKLLLPLFNKSNQSAHLIYKLLLEISDETPSVTYAPLLFPLVSFLSMYLKENQVKNVLITVLGDIDMIPASTDDWNVFCHLLPVLSRKFANSSLKSVPKRDRQELCFWPYALFFLPPPFLIRLLLCYFIEGHKILLRAGIVLLQETCRRQRQHNESIFWREALSTTATNIAQSFSPQTFLDALFQIRHLSRRKIATRKRGLAGAVDIGEWISPTVGRGYVAFRPTSSQSNPSTIVTKAELADVCRHLNPYLAQLNRPVPLFSTLTHGCSLQTLYQTADTIAVTLLLVETVLGDVLGAFCADPWSLRRRLNPLQWYGKGECFVFRVRPAPVAVFRWGQDRDCRRANRFQRATATAMEVGGGAIRIGADLARGRSEESVTFDSPCLAESGRDFLIGRLELLAFQEVH